MQKIPLMRATPGMKLAKDVFRNDSPIGIPVCGKDTVLTDILITRLDNMDVPSIFVEGHPVWESGDRPIEDLLNDLDRRFEKVRQDPLMSRIYDIHADYLKRSLGDDGGRQAQ